MISTTFLDTKRWCILGIATIIQLHLHHLVLSTRIVPERFRYTMTKSDLQHHLIFIPLVAFPALYVAIFSMEEYILVTLNVIALFINGFPGMLIYLGIWLSMNGIVAKEFSMYIDQVTNIFIRLPGLVYGVSRIYLLHPLGIVSVACSLIILFNGMYYTFLSFDRLSRRASQPSLSFDRDATYPQQDADDEYTIQQTEKYT